MGESRGVLPAKYGEVRFTERRMNRDGNLTKIRSRREKCCLPRKRVGVRTHRWRRESEQKFRSWESTVLGGPVFEAEFTLGQLKSPNTVQSDRREMMVSSVQIRDMLSGGGLLGLLYTRAIVNGSVLKSRSYIIRLTYSEEEVVGGSSTRWGRRLDLT